jgi:uncharacterized membrane protein HdeD (DUF308 family)
LSAGMAALFAVTGVLLLTDSDGSLTTPAALVGWFLMVRGAADIAVSMMTRETDRIWGLLLVVGLAEAGLGFFAASSFGRTVDLMIAVLAGLALLRGVADLVAALRLREAPHRSALELPAERAAGVAGYSAGLTDFAAEPVRPRHRYRDTHRTTPESAVGTDPGMSSGSGMGMGMGTGMGTGTGWAADADTGTAGRADSSGGSPDMSRSGGPYLIGGVSGGDSPAGTGSGGSFHDEVLRTTADLDAMLALAGVTGAAGAGLDDHHDLPAAPDTPAGVELPGTAGLPAGQPAAAGAELADLTDLTGGGTGDGPHPDVPSPIADPPGPADRAAAAKEPGGM